MRVYFVGAGPGDPELLTRKAERLLRACRCCVYAGSLVSPAVLELLPSDCQRHDSARLSLEEIVAVFEAAQRAGVDVVRLHSGDPSIYGATREQMTELDALKVEYEVVPGVSSFQAAAAALKVELTAPEVAQTIVLTRASGRVPVPEEQELARLAATRATLCVFLSVHQVSDIARTLAPHYGEDCPAAVVYRASWPDQRILTGSLADLGAKTEAAGIGRTALILVGRALARGVPASKLYDRRFSHSYRAASQE
ncbi:MAG: precorrin-4 C(11)-methyltransferase [Myxococcaceae bacterium]